MKILCVFGKHNYGNPEKGQGYEYTNFLPALERLGHTIEFFESFDRSAYEDFSELNRRFLERVENLRPDVIFLVLMGYELWTETLDRVRHETHAKVINWGTDDSWKFDQFSKFVTPHVDIHATTYPEALNASKRFGYQNVVLTQWAANAAALNPPAPAEKCRWDVSFVGMAYGNRPRWVSELRKRGIDVRCFGFGWPNGPVPASRIPEIVRRSVISLNFGDSDWVMDGLRPRRDRQIKARIFEVLGYGGFLMTERAENIEKFYVPGKEIVSFETIDELAQSVKYFLAHPEERDRIARAGHARTALEHTYDHRFAELLERVKACERQEPKIVNHIGSGLCCDEDFSRLEKRHQTGPLLRMLRAALLIPCRIIWGPQRGARAARRLLFELSWRIAGKKTYSASGWPGRLFYKES